MEVYYNKLILFLESRLNHKYWYLSTTMVTVFTILLLTGPSYYALTKEFKPCGDCVDFQDVINRADHLLKPSIYQEASHMANTELRLTVPIIAKVIGTRSKIVMFIVQEILGITFFIFCTLWAYRLTKDKITSAAIALSLGFVYVGKAAFVDTQGLADSFAFFFLSLALFSLKRPLILLGLLLAYFTDERAIASSSFIAILYLLEYFDTTNGKIDVGQFFNSRLFYIGLSWLLYIAIRFILFKLYGLHNPAAGLVLPDLRQLGYLFWDGLQGFWLLLICGVIYLVAQKRFFILSILTFCFLVMVITTSMVYDLTRSIAYIFPIIFVALYLTQKATSMITLRKVVLLSCLICFLCGDSFTGVYATPNYYRSVPAKAIEKLILHQH